MIAIDTATAGTKAFTVTATDQAGNTSSKVVHYTVVVPPSTGSFTVKGQGKVGKDFKFQIDAKTGTKKPSGEVEIDVKGHSFQGTVTAITITGSTAVLTGTGFDNGRRVNFTLTVTNATGQIVHAQQPACQPAFSCSCTLDVTSEGSTQRFAKIEYDSYP